MKDLTGKGKPFHSSLDKAAALLKRKVGTGAEFMQELKALGGVKQSEVDERKLGEIMGMPRMTHDQFMANLSTRPIPAIREKVLGGEPDKKKLEHLAREIAYEYAYEELRDEGMGMNQAHDVANDLSAERYPEHMEEARRQLGDNGATYHERWTLPGGENYREMLIKSPKANKYWAQKYGGEKVFFDNPEEASEHAGSTGQAARVEGPDQEFGGVGAHFGGEPGILASLRLKDRIVPGDMGFTIVNKRSGNKGQHYNTQEEALAALQGYPESLRPNLALQESRGPSKKLLHLEELQSDWHQQGRKKGYRGDYEPEAAMLKKRDELYDARTALVKQALAIEKTGGTAPQELIDQIHGMNDELRTVEERKDKARNAVPDAPLKKNWEEAAIKRLVHHAAEKGYHGIVVTPGAEQADRYSLAQHIDSIMLTPNPHPNKETHPYYFKAFDKEGNRVADDTVNEDKLQEYIGKEPAKQLLSAKPNPMGERMVSGANIVTGDKAMKKFYDEKVPNILNAIGKKHGVKTQLHGHKLSNAPKNSMDVAHYPRGQEYIGGQITWPEMVQANPELANKFQTPLHHFPITEDMRKDILTNGLPLYKEGGIIRKAEGGNVQLSVEQMRQQLMSAGKSLPDISQIGAQEAPSMPVKSFVIPQNGAQGPMPMGGVDMSPMQPGQQMIPANAMQPNPLMPQQPQQPTGPAPMGGGSNILQMTPQGQKMAALAGSPQGNLPPPKMAIGGAVPMPVNNHPFQAASQKPMPFMAKDGGSDNAPMNNNYSDNGATDYNMDNIQQLALGGGVQGYKDGSHVSHDQYQDLLQRHLAGERLSKDQNMKLGLYHTISENKLKKPTHMMSASYMPDPKQPMVPEQFITPEAVYGGAGIPFIGDSTRGGQLLTHVDSKRLRNPVELQSGKDFMRVIRPKGENAGWASGTSVISDLANKTRTAAQMADKVYGLHATMTGTGADFSSMPTKTLLEMLDRKKIDPAAMDAFDAEIRKFYPAFKGIRSPALRKQLLAPGAGEVRKLFVTKMNMEPFQKAGFPDVAHARFAVQHPELLKRPLNSIGAAISQLEPAGRIIKNPSMPHYDYPDQLAQERYAGGFDVPMHRGEIFQDWEAGRRASKASPSSDPRSFDLSTPIQKFDQNWLDKVMPIYLARRKALLGKKKGGDVNEPKVTDNLDTMRLALTRNKKAK